MALTYHVCLDALAFSRVFTHSLYPVWAGIWADIRINEITNI